MDLQDILSKTWNGEQPSRTELIYLLSLPAHSAESYQVMAEARRMSAELTGNTAEVHAQLALNLAPCPCNCVFCAFAQKNGVFTEDVRLTPEQAVDYAVQFETDGANAIYIMTTGHYPFGLFLEISQEIRSNLRAETVLIANVGDQSYMNAGQMRESGFSGVYHARRLREGIDSALDPARREESIRNFREAGLDVGTCVEPVGPEHTVEELAEMIEFTASFNPSYSGAARRIAIPGTDIAARGMVSELRMAQIVAVTRLGMPRTVPGNCTHEPCTLGALAGANLFWAEAGANPRDTREKTEEGRGETVGGCRTIFEECDWKVYHGTSRYYQRKQVEQTTGAERKSAWTNRNMMVQLES